MIYDFDDMDRWNSEVIIYKVRYLPPNKKQVHSPVWVTSHLSDTKVSLIDHFYSGVRMSINTCAPLFPCDIVCTWPRSTSGRCSYISPPRTWSPCGTLGRSTWGHSRRHRCSCRCRRARVYRECPTWGSFHRSPVKAQGTLNPSPPGICDLGCEGAVEIGIGLFVAPCVAPHRFAALAPPGPCWASWPATRHRNDPSTRRPQSGSSAASSSKSWLCTNPTCRDTYIPAASPFAHAGNKTTQSTSRSLIYSIIGRSIMMSKYL